MLLLLLLLYRLKTHLSSRTGRLELFLTPVNLGESLFWPTSAPVVSTAPDVSAAVPAVFAASEK